MARAGGGVEGIGVDGRRQGGGGGRRSGGEEWGWGLH